MTYVLLANSAGAERVIQVPIVESFTAFLKLVRDQVPSRKWSITEAWNNVDVSVNDLV